MGSKKLLFFDVDGTLWDYKNHIPDSTKEAIAGLKKNGHEVFINTGRAFGHLRHPNLLNLDFNGIITGCGTNIQYNGDLIFEKYIDNTELSEALTRVGKCGFRSILEGFDYIYLDIEEWNNDYYVNKLKEDLTEELHGITSEWGKWERVGKFSCDMSDADVEAGIASVSDWFYAIVHNETVVEFVPHGFGKGHGIRFMCEYLGTDIADTFAFGDSSNDLDMLKTAGVGIVMGNAMDEVAKHGDYVTDTLQNDGIYKACEHFGLI